VSDNDKMVEGILPLYNKIIALKGAVWQMVAWSVVRRTGIFLESNALSLQLDPSV
jgi:hypothetical protein